MALSYVAVGPICASSPDLDGNIQIWNSTAYRALQAADGESFAPGVQSPVPPTRRSTLQSVNWSNKHRRVKSSFYFQHLHFVLHLLPCYASLSCASLCFTSELVLLPSSMFDCSSLSVILLHIEVSIGNLK